MADKPKTTAEKIGECLADANSAGAAIRALTKAIRNGVKVDARVVQRWNEKRKAQEQAMQWPQ